MIIEAPCKVNLHLNILDQRPDGFHNIESLFVALDFCDILQFKPKFDTNEPELEIDGKFAQNLIDLNIKKNIIFKAYSLFAEKTGLNPGVKITLNKKIPLGGGLGGGSSNAASTLLALNKLTEYPLDKIELLELGASLGSDVPFFIHRISAAWVTGRGEYIDSLDPPTWHFVLVNPGFHSDTARAFRLLAENREQGTDIIKNKTCPLTLNPHSLFNDFLEVLPEKDTYSKIIGQLTNLGAEYANLSGSGSTCFGAFKEREEAEKAVSVLSKEWDFVQSGSIKQFD